MPKPIDSWPVTVLRYHCDFYTSLTVLSTGHQAPYDLMELWIAISTIVEKNPQSRDPLFHTHGTH